MLCFFQTRQYQLQTTTLNGTGGSFTEDNAITQVDFKKYWTNLALNWRDKAPVDWAALGPLSSPQAMRILFNGTASTWNGNTTLTGDEILKLQTFAYRLNVDVEYEWLASADNLDFQIFDSDLNFGGSNAPQWYFPQGFDMIGEYLINNGTGGPERILYNKRIVAINYTGALLGLSAHA